MIILLIIFRRETRFRYRPTLQQAELCLGQGGWGSCPWARQLEKKWGSKTLLGLIVLVEYLYRHDSNVSVLCKSVHHTGKVLISTGSLKEIVCRNKNYYSAICGQSLPRDLRRAKSGAGGVGRGRLVTH